jgi:hypothetical protein
MTQPWWFNAVFLAALAIVSSVLVAFGQDQPPLPRDKAIGLFLIFSIGKTIYHGDRITGRN